MAIQKPDREKPLRWLEWTLVDPSTIIGGVEVHLLAMAQTLQKNGCEIHYSSRFEDLFENDWDVIRTHGAALPGWYGYRIKNRRPFRIHTLHGTSLGAMKALGQFWRMTFWKGAYREFSGCWNADLVCSVNPHLLIFKFFQLVGSFRGQTTHVVENGWNAAEALQDSLQPGAPLSNELKAELLRRKPFFCFIGRSHDAIKGSDRIKKLMALDPPFHLVAIPGDGFDKEAKILKTGRLKSDAIAQILALSDGLILTSKLEAKALVVLEALAEGVPVLSTPVGALPDVGPISQGLYWIHSPDDPFALKEQVTRILSEMTNDTNRLARKKWNREHLATWEHSAKELLMHAKDRLKKKATESL